MDKNILLVAALIGMVVGECAAQRRLAWPEYDGPVPFVQKEVDAIGKFTYERRIQIRENLNDIAFRLLRIPWPEPLKTEKYPGSATTIAVYDKDSDGRADMFATDASRSTQNFWFIFDLNHDSRTDYAIFNGGVWLDKSMGSHWYNYHYVDSNNDGKVDILIYTADPDGDKFFNEDVGAWLYDSDHDGKIDKGEYLGRDDAESIPEEDGTFLVKESPGELQLQEKDLNNGLGGSSKFLSVVDSLIARPK
jgi:hypothetical protein